MIKHTERILLFLALLTLPLVASAQSDEPVNRNEKSEIKVNKLDVIYEDEEYEGVVIDNRNDKETENNLYQPPFIVDPDEEYDEEDEIPSVFSIDDDGVDSEEDILFEGFDTAAIHLPKLDVSTITAPILVQLCDKERGEKFTWPTPWSARPSSHFGPRRRRFHYGLDLALPTGEPIYAAFDGVVRISKRNKSYGHLVIIHHANGLETYYAHMSERHVSAGDQVKSGDIIGLCGNTGRSRGSHLHFEIRYMGNAINPENVIDCSTHDLISDQLSLTSSSFRKVAKGGKGGKGGEGSGGTWYRVRQGDTLEKIARRNGTTVKRLCQLNGIKQNKILHPGDKLKVSGSAASSKGSTAKADSGKNKTKGGNASSYTVRKGDTLSKIASKNGISVKELCRLNGIQETSTLRIGQKLKLK
jgi:murein DD-endopeptidase MepM/ murein hydrolase activator NlpD